MANTVSQLALQIKQKIDELHDIVDVLLSEYRNASDFIDDEADRRELYLSQLKELNENISNLVDQHPALSVEKSWQHATNIISLIATESENQTHI